MDRFVRNVLVSILFLTALFPLLSYTPTISSQDMTTITRFATSTTYFTSLEHQTFTQQEKQSFHQVFTVSSAPKPLPGHTGGTCMIFALGPFKAEAGDEVSGTVSADVETISLGILDEGRTSSLMDLLTNPSDYMQGLAFCITLRLYMLDSHTVVHGNGIVFSVWWKATSPGDYYFVFENDKTTPVHASLDAVLTSFTYSTSTMAHTPTTTITTTNVGITPRYIYLVQENILPLVLLVSAFIIAAFVLRRSVLRRRTTGRKFACQSCARKRAEND
jgi:hypothetical protein